MRKIILLLVCVIAIYLIYLSSGQWQNLYELRRKNSNLQSSVNEMKRVLLNLQSLTDRPLGSLQESYKAINKKIILFSRSHDLRTTIDFIKNNKKGFVSEVEEDSQWLGIKQIVLDIKFYGIKDLDECMLVIGFLDTLESSNHLKVMEIVQKENCLFTKVYIYGRGI